MLNKALNVGVIGLGIGKEHAKGVKATAGACLYAICDPDTARAADGAAELSPRFSPTTGKCSLTLPLTR